MLSLEKVQTELKKYNYPYNDNILSGHTKSKVKWILPAGSASIIAFEQATSYLFGFNSEGVTLFPIEGDWNIIDSLLIPWKEIEKFKMKNGLLEQEMIIKTKEMTITMKISKYVVNNPWIKNNMNDLKINNYFYKEQ